MPSSEAHKRATRKYEASHYDPIKFDVPKGDKARIQSAAQAAGQSLSAYIRQAIYARMESEGVKCLLNDENSDESK